MRFGAILLAALALLAAGAANADEGDPDWVFHISQPTMDHFCWNPNSTPDVDVPWEKVAWGEFEFYFWREAGFRTPDPVPCIVSYGGQQVQVSTDPQPYECNDEPGCYDHGVSVSGAFVVQAPTSAHDFTVSIATDYCNLVCSSMDCQSWGELEGTLYLYAEPTATANASWSTIKAMY
jgi:hypothetical protein